MRKIINSTYITLDGVIADPQDWPGNGIEPDGTGTKVQLDLLFGCDALLMGAHTLTDPEWANTHVIAGDDAIDVVRRLKEEAGQDIVQYGFGQLSYALLEHGLLDELRLWVHPLFFGQATADSLLFRPAATTQLELAGTLALNTGTVILTYRVPSVTPESE
jgi:dihydrofolate reductase